MKSILVSTLVALACLTSEFLPAAEPAPRPHVVFFLIDDLGWSDVGFHGGEIKTPQIDRLAAAGARLEAFYVQPVCSPTRAALMTGRYPMRLGLQVGVIRPWADYGLPLEEKTLAQKLHEAGYFTAICGKWHLGNLTRDYLPTRRGFDHQYGHYCGAIDYFTHIRDGGFDWHRNDQACRDEGYSTTLLGDEATKVIGEHDAKSPLFLYVPFNAPHSPLQALDEHLKLYEHIANPKRRAYAAMVHCVDEQIGRVVKAIDERGWTERTLFIFSSDNGGPIGSGATNGSLRAGKGTLYEGGVRVAAFATWAGQIKRGTTIKEPLHIADWHPTLLRLAGAEIQQEPPLDGRDFWPTLTAGAPSPHEEILLNVAPSGGALRRGDWKLVVGGQSSAVDESTVEQAPQARRPRRAGAQRTPDSVELFNLADDPSEKTNLAKSHPDKARELKERLDKYAQQAVPPKATPQPANYKAPAIWGESD